MIVIRCVELTGRASHPANRSSPRGMFLKAYDPEAHDGRGHAEWTRNIEHALKFSTTGEAWMLWRSVSTTRPTREDGEPNRPLTAFSIEVGDEMVYTR